VAVGDAANLPQFKFQCRLSQSPPLLHQQWEAVRACIRFGWGIEFGSEWNGEGGGISCHKQILVGVHFSRVRWSCFGGLFFSFANATTT
jgi:hypothetical protein